MSYYAGDLTPKEAFNALQTANKSECILIDVRTHAEWSYVGLPDLRAVSKEPLLVQWQTYPSMQVDGSFAGKVEELVAQAGGNKHSKLLFLCRSGARSKSAANALTEAGYSHSYNILDGFEGVPNSDGQRGQVSGWKAEGLPWRQG